MIRARVIARGRIRPAVRSSTEALYEQHLAARLALGEIVWYRYEAIKLRLADMTHYTPDYVVMLSTGEIEVHEVKGFWRDDARVKIKVAAEMYPFRFIAVNQRPKRDGGGWEIEEIGATKRNNM